MKLKYIDNRVTDWACEFWAEEDNNGTLRIKQDAKLVSFGAHTVAYAIASKFRDGEFHDEILKILTDSDISIGTNSSMTRTQAIKIAKKEPTLRNWLKAYDRPLYGECITTIMGKDDYDLSDALAFLDSNAYIVWWGKEQGL